MAGVVLDVDVTSDYASERCITSEVLHARGQLRPSLIAAADKNQKFPLMYSLPDRDHLTLEGPVLLKNFVEMRAA